MGMEEVGIGLVQLGRDDVVESRFTAMEPITATETAVVNSWPTQIGMFADWDTVNRTEQGSMVSLANQNRHLAAHPLPMGLEEVGMGLQQLARDSFMESQFIEADPSYLIELDALATEDFITIVDEDTGEPLRLG